MSGFRSPLPDQQRRSSPPAAHDDRSKGKVTGTGTGSDATADAMGIRSCRRVGRHRLRRLRHRPTRPLPVCRRAADRRGYLPVDAPTRPRPREQERERLTVGSRLKDGRTAQEQTVDGETRGDGARQETMKRREGKLVGGPGGCCQLSPDAPIRAGREKGNGQTRETGAVTSVGPSSDPPAG